MQFRKISVVTIFTCISFFTLAQKENNNWFFGSRAGISFNTNPPTAISSGQIVTDEGVASASSASGELLFYTDGRTVWNKNHQIMSNGTGLNGHISSTQSALITSDPQNCNTYYIFTTDAIENGLNKGLQYSKVNMNLNNGAGGVEQKNITLAAPVAEKVVAIPNIAEHYIWLIAHQWNSSNFLIFKISSDGIELSRTQSIGSVHGGDFINAVGYMKASADGSKVALINRSISSAEIFNFDITTGLLSDNIILGDPLALIYGLEFSPDGSRIYVGTSNQIYQFKIDPYTQADVTSSRTLITSSSNLIRSLQRGPNGKIYVAINNQPFIGVINNPNLSGSNAGYQENAMGLTGLCKFGLPPITVSIGGGPPPVFELGKDTILCVGQTLTLDLSDVPGDYLWQDGSTNSKLIVSTPGLYIGKISNPCGEHIDSIKVEYHEPISLDLGEDILLCENETLVYNVSVPNGNYLWQDGSTSPNYFITAPGTYYVQVMNMCQVLKDTLHITSFELFDLLPPDTVLCPGIPLFLTASGPGDFTWSDGTTSPDFTIQTPGKYFIELNNRCGVFADTINVEAHELIRLDLGEDILLCENETLVYNVSVPDGNYLWQDGSTSPIYTIRAAGTYSVQVTNSCQVLKDTLQITAFQISDILPPDTILCAGQPLFLTVSGPGDFAWSDGTTQPEFTVYSSGKYYVELSNRCGIYSDTIAVSYRDMNQLFIPNVMTPNADGLNDYFIIDNKLLGSAIKIMNRWGNTIFESTNYKNNWRAEGIPIGNYYYYIIDPCGTAYKGWVQILN